MYKRYTVEMKITLHLLLIPLIIVCFPFAAMAQVATTTPQYDSNTEKIEQYDTLIEVQTDASIQVTETIVYNFGSNERHGIYRDIPIRYTTKSGTDEKLDVQNVTVNDEDGNSYKFTTSNKGSDRRIKIGNTNVLLSGVHTYVIKYTVPYAIGSFPTYDEIYWNAIGTEWEVPIKNVTAKITFPFEVPDRKSGSFEFGIACYTGPEGSNTPCDGFGVSDISASGATTSYTSYTSVTFSQPALAPSEGLTVAAGFPKDLVTEPPRPWWWPLLPFLPYAFTLLPILAFVIQLRRWQKHGRDLGGTSVIIPQYEAPDNLSPMQIKFILSESFGTSLSAEIVYLATRGYLKIARIERKVLFITAHDYELTKLKEVDSALTSFQTTLLMKLFTTDSVKLSNLENQFYVTAQKVEGDCEKSLVTDGYFPPRKRDVALNGVRAWTYTTSESLIYAFIIIVFGLFLSTWAGIATGSTLAGILTFSGFVVFGIFEIFMPRRTPKGVLTKEKIEGFKLYLSVAEKNRITFHDAPEKSPEVFQKFLPYAMSLGVVDSWAKVFEGITLAPPTWYSDSSLTSFNSVVFSSSMSSFATTSSSSLSSAPGGSSGSGGGGSSGGGGGGGGGGSW